MDAKPSPHRFPLGILLSTALVALVLSRADSPLNAAETVDPRTGIVTVTEVDLRLRTGAMSVNIERVYDPEDSAAGLFGGGWRLTLEKRFVRKGAGMQIREADGIVAFKPTGSAGVFTGRPGDQLTLRRDGAIRQRPDAVSERYGKDGNLTEIRHRGGDVIRLEYDPAGRLARVEGSGDAWLRFRVNAAGQLAGVDSSTGATATYGYNGGKLTEVQINGGPVTRYSYDAEHRLVRIEKPRTGARELAYDSQGRVIERRFADGTAEHYVYDDTGRGVQVTDPAGGVTSIRRSTDGREEVITDAMGRRTTLRLDGSGHVSSVTGPSGLVTRYTYDALGRMVSSRMPDFESRYEYLGDTPLVAAIAYSDGSRQTFQYDANRNLLAVKEGAETVSEFSYFPNGQIASLKQKKRPELRFTYDPDGRLQSETEVGGRSWRLAYDRRGNPVRETDASGHTTELVYDAQNRVVEATDPAGATTKYVYDDKGRLALMTSPAGRVTRYLYDVRGRLIELQDAAGRTTRYRYDAAGRLTGIAYPGDVSYGYAYDAAGSLVRETNPLGGVTRYGYDALGQLANKTDPTGRTWQYEYAAPGQLGRVIAPGGMVTQVQYDAQHRRSGLVDPAGLAARLERDATGRVTATRFPDGVVRSVAYDSDGRIASESSTAGGSVKFKYDAAGRIAGVLGSSGHDVSVEYNPAGQTARVLDNLGSSLSYEYNPQGLASAVIDEAGRATRISYDASGLPTAIANPLGQARRISYGPAGELAQIAEANGDAVNFEYDSAGNVAALHSPGGGVTRFALDALRNPVEVTDPLGTKTRFAYDLAGRLTSRVDPDGRTTEYTYNEAGRLAQERLPDQHAVNYQYDPAGRLVSVDDGAFPVRYAYDAAGHRTHIEYPAIGKSVSYEYDSGGLLSKFTAPDGRQVRYGYDQHKRLNSMTLADGGAIRFGYDIKGQLTSMEYPNGIHATWERDASGRLAGVSYRNAAQVEIDGCRYAYDDAGRPIRAVGPDGQATEYRYDAAGQLIEESSPSGTIQYTYGPGGNRVRREAGGKAVAYRQNAADQVLEAGDETFEYDRRGNMVERRGPSGTTHYFWDGENRLVRVLKPDGSEVQYGYTAAGSRAWRKDKSGTTYFVTDGINLLADVDEEKAASTIYIHAPGIDRPVAMLRGSQVYFYHTKAPGTVSSLTDSTGNVAAAYRTDAFGNLTASTGTVENRLLFAAREYDADLGLYYYRSRYYDPGLGRFLSPDLAGSTITDPIEGNRYAYARNSPLRYRDPLGTVSLADPTEAEIEAVARDLGTPALTWEEQFQQDYELTPEQLGRLRAAYDVAWRSPFYDPNVDVSKLDAAWQDILATRVVSPRERIAGFKEEVRAHAHGLKGEELVKAAERDAARVKPSPSWDVVPATPPSPSVSQDPILNPQGPPVWQFTPYPPAPAAPAPAPPAPASPPAPPPDAPAPDAAVSDPNVRIAAASADEVAKSKMDTRVLAAAKPAGDAAADAATDAGAPGESALGTAAGAAATLGPLMIDAYAQEEEGASPLDIAKSTTKSVAVGTATGTLLMYTAETVGGAIGLASLPEIAAGTLLVLAADGALAAVDRLAQAPAIRAERSFLANQERLEFRHSEPQPATLPEPAPDTGSDGFGSQGASEVTVQPGAASQAPAPSDVDKLSLSDLLPPVQNSIAPPSGGFGSRGADETTVPPGGFESQGSDEIAVSPGSGGPPAPANPPGGEGSQPQAQPADLGDLTGKWFQCVYLSPTFPSWNEAMRAHCIREHHGINTGAGPQDLVVQFTKSGNQYTGHLAPGSNLAPMAATGWGEKVRYAPGAEVFRLTEISQNQYQGSIFVCQCSSGSASECCKWDPQCKVTLQGDEARVEGNRPNHWVALFFRSAGQEQTQPAPQPADPGELAGDWFDCNHFDTNSWFESKRAQCLETRKGYFADAGQPDRIIQFTKNGNQYSGRLAPGSNTDPLHILGWEQVFRHAPGDEVFRLTKVSQNQYQGSMFTCNCPPGFTKDCCGWRPQCQLVVQGDELHMLHSPWWAVEEVFVRSKGQQLAQPGGQPVDCVAKYCPVCSQSVSLLGASPPDCESCKTRNAAQIAQCNRQPSSPGPGQYDTNGLPDPPVYCAYQIFQPSLNNYRHEIGKCNDAHPSDYQGIFGPDTFMHCRQWLTQKGFLQ
jgi:RHS repeat-associated protein